MDIPFYPKRIKRRSYRSKRSPKIQVLNEATKVTFTRIVRHVDENTIVAACLVKSRVAPPSYTARDYSRDLDTMTFPFSSSSAEFLHCTSDPLGLENSH